MKNLKLRAFNIETQEMCDVISINFEKEEVKLKSLINKKKDSKANFSKVTLLHSTGLKDKNGVEIYEGDQVQHSGLSYRFEGVVHFDVNGCYVENHIECIPMHDFSDIDKGTSNCLIIGNIYA